MTALNYSLLCCKCRICQLHARFVLQAGFEYCSMGVKTEAFVIYSCVDVRAESV